MKLPSFFAALSAALLLLSAMPAFAKGKPKPKAPAPTPIAEPDPARPAEALSPYINHIDQLLAIERTGPRPLITFCNEASGHLITLRQAFISRRQEAPEADRGKFEAGIATCDVLIRSLDERQQVLGDLQSSGSVQGSGKLEKGPRKDNLTQGIKGGDVAKAVGSIVERDREREANKDAKKSAAHSDDALSAMAENRWNKRTIELRKAITDTYSRIK